MFRALGAVAITIFASSASAQIVRCDTPAGVVYQQGSCPGGRELTKAPEQGLSKPGPGAELCSASAATYFKDPDSVKINSIARGTMRDVPMNGTDVRVRVYVMMVNARNSFGGYTGEKPYFCLVSPDETKLFRISNSVL